MIKRKVLTVIFLLTINICFSQEVWMFGPMVHLNFGDGKPNVSYGVEGSYWDISHFLYGVDAGIEYGSKRLRLYSELQTGFALAGVAFGPVLEYNTGESQLHLGTQYTLWANYFWGFDYRHRWIDKTKFNCIGTYVKIPVKNIEDDGSKSSIFSGSSHHHHDWD